MDILEYAVSPTDNRSFVDTSYFSYVQGFVADCLGLQQEDVLVSSENTEFDV